MAHGAKGAISCAVRDCKCVPWRAKQEISVKNYVEKVKAVPFEEGVVEAVLGAKTEVSAYLENEAIHRFKFSNNWSGGTRHRNPPHKYFI